MLSDESFQFSQLLEAPINDAAEPAPEFIEVWQVTRRSGVRGDTIRKAAQRGTLGASWLDGWRSLRFMMLMSPRWLFLVPGLLMALAGAVVCAALLPGPLHFSWIGFDTTTMLVGAMMLLLGFQVIIYAFFSRLFAVSEGLLPPDPLLNKVFRYVTLETGIIAGSTAALGGLLLLIYATVLWGKRGFGAFDYSQSQRIVIPAVTAIVLGMQVIFSSFFLSVLGLRRR